MRREAVDFHLVPEHQLKMHERLENWARSLFSGSSSKASPMFRLYRSSEQWNVPHVVMPYDSHDAIRIAKGVRELPEQHQAALDWHYIRPGSPQKARKAIGCTLHDLARYVIDGRQILINRRV